MKQMVAAGMALAAYLCFPADQVETNAKPEDKKEFYTKTLKTLAIPNARKHGWTGKGVKIAIIDGGIDDHRFLKVAERKRFYPTGEIKGSKHGTHVAGIIASRSVSFPGVAPDAEIYSAEIFDQEGKSRPGSDGIDIVKAIYWAIEKKVDIINLSLSAPPFSAVYVAIQEAQDQGIMVVAAAGNKGENQVTYPAAINGVISVGALNNDYQKAGFSNYGDLDFVAPGTQVLSTVPGSRMGLASGTSMAAPYVTGVLALYKEAYPYASNKEILLIASMEAKDMGWKGKDQFFGYGLIQAPQTNSRYVALAGETSPSSKWLIKER